MQEAIGPDKPKPQNQLGSAQLDSETNTPISAHRHVRLTNFSCIDASVRAFMNERKCGVSVAFTSCGSGARNGGKVGHWLALIG